MHHTSTLLRRYNERCTIIVFLLLFISVGCDTEKSSDTSALSLDAVVLRIGDAVHLVDRGEAPTALRILDSLSTSLDSSLPVDVTIAYYAAVANAAFDAKAYALAIDAAALEVMLRRRQTATFTLTTNYLPHALKKIGDTATALHWYTHASRSSNTILARDAHANAAWLYALTGHHALATEHLRQWDSLLQGAKGLDIRSTAWFTTTALILAHNTFTTYPTAENRRAADILSHRLQALYDTLSGRDQFVRGILLAAQNHLPAFWHSITAEFDDQNQRNVHSVTTGRNTVASAPSSEFSIHIRDYTTASLLQSTVPYTLSIHDDVSRHPTRDELGNEWICTVFGTYVRNGAFLYRLDTPGADVHLASNAVRVSEHQVDEQSYYGQWTSISPSRSLNQPLHDSSAALDVIWAPVLSSTDASESASKATSESARRENEIRIMMEFLGHTDHKVILSVLDIASNKQIRTFYSLPGNRLLCGTRRGLCIIHLHTGQIETVRTNSHFIDDHQVDGIYPRTDGRLAIISSYGGVTVFPFTIPGDVNFTQGIQGFREFDYGSVTVSSAVPDLLLHHMLPRDTPWSTEQHDTLHKTGRTTPPSYDEYGIAVTVSEQGRLILRRDDIVTYNARSGRVLILNKPDVLHNLHMPLRILVHDDRVLIGYDTGFIIGTFQPSSALSTCRALVRHEGALGFRLMYDGDTLITTETTSYVDVGFLLAGRPAQFRSDVRLTLPDGSSSTFGSRYATSSVSIQQQPESHLHLRSMLTNTSSSITITRSRSLSELPIFRILALLLLGLLIFVVIIAFRLRRRERQRSVELAAAHARLEIARDVHDMIGADLVRLAAVARGLSDGDERTKLSNLIANTGRSLRDLVSTTRDVHDVHQVCVIIIEYVRQHAEDIGAYADVQVALDERWITISPTRARDLLMIVREIIANATKHALPERFYIRVGTDPMGTVYLDLHIAGGSTQRSDTPSDGNGVVSIRHRADRSGFRLEYSFDEGGTTRATLSFQGDTA